MDSNGLAKMLGDLQGDIEINGNTLYYELNGAGELLILLHDGLMDSGAFDHQVAVFSKYFTVLRYDRPGYGNSPAPVKDYSVVEDLNWLINRLAVNQFSLLGASAGGQLALDFSLAYGDKLKNMVLVGPGLSGYPYSTHMYSRGIHESYPESLEERLELWLSDPWFVSPKNEAAREQMREILSKNLHNLSFDEVEQINNIEAYLRLHEISTDTLLIIGVNDIADNHAVGGILDYTMKNIKKEYILDSGHVPYLEKTDEFNQKVLAFLMPELRKI